MTRTIFAVTLFTSLGVAQQNVQITPVTATIVNTNTRKVPGGQPIVTTTEGKYYRDSQGRTRTERGNQVVIQDPARRTKIVLDTSAKVARVSVASQGAPASTNSPVSADVLVPVPEPVTAAAGSTTRPRIIREPLVDLGTQVIGGVMAKGYRATVVVPVGAMRNVVPITQTGEIWRSQALRIPVMSKTTDSLRGERLEVYRNIVTNVSPDPALFAIPADFQVIEPGSTASAEAP